jgi:hypothetical protein
MSYNLPAEAQYRQVWPMVFNKGYNIGSLLLAVLSIRTLLAEGRVRIYQTNIPMLTIAALIPIISWGFLNAATGVLLTFPLRHRLYFLPAILLPTAISFGTI